MTAPAINSPPPFGSAWYIGDKPTPQLYRWFQSLANFVNGQSDIVDNQTQQIAALQQQVFMLTQQGSDMLIALQAIEAVADPTGGATVDAQSRAAINAIIAACQGL